MLLLLCIFGCSDAAPVAELTLVLLSVLILSPPRWSSADMLAMGFAFGGATAVPFLPLECAALAIYDPSAA